MTVFFIYWFFNNHELIYLCLAAALTSSPLLWTTRLLGTLTAFRSLSWVYVTLLTPIILIATIAQLTNGGLNIKFSITSLNYINYTTPIHLAVSLDAGSTPFFLVTLLLGSVALGFTHFYMEGEVYKTRFVQLLTAFLLSMLLLLSANNFVTLFLGWELIGLFSFLLINFWTIKTTSIKSANKALTYNQLSDAFFMVMIVGFYFQGVEICTSPGTAPTTPLALAALVVCVCCKSAQFPFHFWLPDSMEAPIPASALIHSATLVSAGVYLILRLSAYHSFSQFLTYPLTFLSLLTVVVGGVASCMQNDLKKVLAYSTIANCGFMVLFAALNKNSLCFLYFALHGVFKAATFFLVGTIVINSHHKQDWRYLTTPLGHKNALLYLFIPTVALLGAWPGTMTGFVKHLNINLVNIPLLSHTVWCVSWVGTLTSLIYSTKIVSLVYQSDSVKSVSGYEGTTHLKQQINQIFFLLTFVLFLVLQYYNQTPLIALDQGTNLTHYSIPIFNSITGVLALITPLLLNYWLRVTYPNINYLTCLTLLLCLL